MERARILGVDWATEAKKRAAVELVSTPRSLTLASVRTPFTDAEAASALTDAGLAVMAVDTPFGWPSAFTSFVSKWSATRGHPTPSSTDFSFRRTDLVVRAETGKQPLSVSSDRIALCTRSWASVVHAKQATDRVDVGQAPTRPIIEVYPGASLVVFARRYELELEHYKKDWAIRRTLVRRVASLFGVEGPNELIASLAGTGNDDSDPTDAFIAALTAVAYLERLAGWDVRRPRDEELIAAQTEGWIYFPTMRA